MELRQRATLQAYAARCQAPGCQATTRELYIVSYHRESTGPYCIQHANAMANALEGLGIRAAAEYKERTWVHRQE